MIHRYIHSSAPTVSNSKSSEINKVIRSIRVYLYTDTERERAGCGVWTLCNQYLGTLNQTWVTKLPHLYLNCKLSVPSTTTKPLSRLLLYIYFHSNSPCARLNLSHYTLKLLLKERFYILILRNSYLSNRKKKVCTRNVKYIFTEWLTWCVCSQQIL